MCTLIVLHRSIPEAPLVVAANRDEFLDRPSEGPGLRRLPGGRRAMAPLDLRAGGTWLGVGEQGLFAAVTNRRCTAPDPARRSRGRVVLDALRAPHAAAAAEHLAALEPGAYNPFNALVADAREAFALVYDEAPRLVPLAPGAHVVGNADPDAEDVPKVARVLAGARGAADRPVDAAVEALAALCREHGPEEPSLDDACVHLPGYGTRSSTLIVLGRRPGDSRYLYADGPPCANEYRDFTPLLLELGRPTACGVEETATRAAS